MTITLKPQTEERLRALAAKENLSVEAVLERMVENQAQGEGAKADAPERKTLFELALPIRGLLTDEEIDTLFARDRSPSRTIDF